MIPISYHNKAALNNVYEKIIKGRSTKISDLDKWCKDNLIVKGEELSFKEVVLADFKTLSEIVSCLDSTNSILPESLSNYMKKTMYGKKLDKARIIELLGLSLCPYCNRGFLDNIKKHRSYQIDHFFPKDKYPILAVSFYNLVPCCYACNHLKSNSMISYSPHNPDYKSANELVEFSTWITDLDYLTNTNSIGIHLDYDSIMAKNVETFGLNDVYSLHKREVQELLKKAIVFPSKYIDDVMEIYSPLFKEKEEVIHLIYGFGSEKNFSSEPLSKLKYDIGKEIIDEL